MDVLLQPGGTTRLGEYELLRRLGRGGMATVYLARARDGRHVAVKMLHAELAWDEDLRARFRSEVNRLQQVPSSCTAAILDADFDHDPPFLVVEYVDGPSLAEVVRDQGPLGPAALRGVAIGITTALAEIHGAGVIHRDLKPENVLLGRFGAKVIDFGIARAVEATSLHTRLDQMIGTVAYMAPERFGDDASALLSPASDVFAWGVLVAYAANGRTPFAGDSPPATAVRIISEPPDLGGLRGPLRFLVERALHKDPAKRPTAAELLQVLLNPDMSPSKPVAHKRPRRKRAPLVVAAGLAVLGIAAVPMLRDHGAGSAAQELPVAAAEQGGEAGADGPAQKPATGTGMLELVSQMFPDRAISDYTVEDGDGSHVVRFLLDDGRLTIGVHGGGTDRTGAPVLKARRDPSDCSQDTTVLATWDDGTGVQVDVDTCDAAPALSLSDAKKVAADPRWGTEMDADLVDEGADQF